MTKTAKEHREEIIKKVLPYLEGVTDNIKMQGNESAHHAFGLLVANVSFLLELASKSKGDEEFMQFSKLVNDMIEESVRVPLGLSKSKTNTGIIDGSQLSKDERERIINKLEKENKGYLEVGINKQSGEIEIKGNLKEAPREVIDKLVGKLKEFGVPAEDIKKAVAKNILGGI